jgi:protein-S-isoprenylcysteine O-methyltransferase Ste14
MITALVGVAMLLDRAIAWLVIPPFAALLYYRFVRHEEALMAQTFGTAYLDYKARVRRWF